MTPQPVDLEALQQRLQQRLGYLQHDPDNVLLFSDCIDLAISLADWPTVQALLPRAPAAVEDAARANYQAIHDLGCGRPDLAIQALQPFLQPDDASPLQETLRYNAAYALALNGEPAAAEQLLARRDGAQLNDESSHLLMHVLMMQDRGEEAIRVGEAFWRAGRRAPRALGIYALALSDSARYEEADAVARQALLQRDDTLALCAQGMVRLGTGSALSAQPCFERSLQLDNRNGRSWLGLGLCQMVAGELEAARSTLQQAVRFNEKHAGTWHALGWTLLALNQIGEAEAAFVAALEVDRSFADTHGALAVISAARGHLVEAEHSASVALRLDPHSMTGLYAKALLAGSKGETQKGEAMISGLLSSQMADGASLLEAINRIRRR